MVIIKTLDATKGINMIEAMLEKYKDKLPTGKTINDFGGGYVEVLKTKAKVVLYFGFDSSKNRVSFNFQVRKEEVLLWTEAIAEKLWNVENVSDDVVSFGSEINTSQTEKSAEQIVSAGEDKDKDEDFAWS